jgi:hypothetical protein
MQHMLLMIPSEAPATTGRIWPSTAAPLWVQLQLAAGECGQQEWAFW